MPRVAVPLVSLVVFTAYTASVAANHDIVAFFTNEVRGGWTLQIFIDLIVAATCFWVVAVPDARARGIRVWPYIALTPWVGSIALLGYFVHRSVVAPKPGTTAEQR